MAGAGFGHAETIVVKPDRLTWMDNPTIWSFSKSIVSADVRRLSSMVGLPLFTRELR
jgi:hypothetical protein